jgi:hypothetical protein
VNRASPNLEVRDRWWLPSSSAIIWIALFLGLGLTDARVVALSGDSDPALHRRLGEWMIQHHVIIHEDDLLHTYHGSSMAKEWLSEVLFAAAGRLFGWNGFVLLAATLIATCFWLLHRQLLAEGCDVIVATGLALVAMLACSMHWLARPFLFTHVLTVVFAGQLRWFHRGRVSARRLFILLPPLMILWVNLHGAFITGLVLIAMHALGSAIDAWRKTTPQHKSKVFVGLLLVCGVASLVNPSGWKLHAHIVSFMRSRELSTLTSEFSSPDFHTVGMHGFLLLLFLLAATLLIVRPKLDTTDVLLVGGWGYFALLSARNVPIFALVTTPLLAQWITEFVEANRDAHWSRLYRGYSVRLTTIDRTAGNAAMIAVAVCTLLVMSKSIRTDFPPSRYPTVAVDYLHAYPDAVHGEMFNTFLWGGYLEFALPERRPFIDSRNVLYGMNLVEDFRTADVPKPGWAAVFAKYNVGWTILPVQHPLNRILELSPDWIRVFSNQQALVFTRAS